MRGADEKLCEECAEGSMLMAVGQINCLMQATWGKAFGEGCDSVQTRRARNPSLKTRVFTSGTKPIGLYRRRRFATLIAGSTICDGACCDIRSSKRGVAQPGRALGSGPRGRKFKSCRPDFIDKKPFGENVEGLSHCGDKSYVVETAVQTDDFEDSTFCVVIGRKPFAAKGLRKFKHFDCQVGVFVVRHGPALRFAA